MERRGWRLVPSLCTGVSGPETRQAESSCAVARAPRGAGSVLLGWCGNAGKAPGSRCSLAPHHAGKSITEPPWKPLPEFQSLETPRRKRMCSSPNLGVCIINTVFPEILSQKFMLV